MNVLCFFFYSFLKLKGVDIRTMVMYIGFGLYFRSAVKKKMTKPDNIEIIFGESASTYLEANTRSLMDIYYTFNPFRLVKGFLVYNWGAYTYFKRVSYNLLMPQNFPRKRLSSSILTQPNALHK